MALIPLFHDTRFWYHALIGQIDYSRLLHNFEQKNLIKRKKEFNRNTLKLNSLLHNVLNLHIFPPRNINSTNNNISSGTL